MHRTKNPNLGTPLHRQREDYWIREGLQHSMVVMTKLLA